MENRVHDMNFVQAAKEKRVEVPDSDMTLGGCCYLLPLCKRMCLLFLRRDKTGTGVCPWVYLDYFLMFLN